MLVFKVVAVLPAYKNRLCSRIGVLYMLLKMGRMTHAEFINNLYMYYICVINTCRISLLITCVVSDNLQNGSKYEVKCKFTSFYLNNCFRTLP
jgi:hypothetical protein